MAYSIRHGIDKDGMDNTQRGLLIGLPAIALALSFGAAHHNGSSASKQTAKNIPVVSTVKTASGSGNTGSNDTGGSTGANPASASQTGGSGSAAGYSGSSGASTGVGTSSSGQSGTGSAGGSGGGTGGTTTGGLGGGGTAPLPDCSIGQIATVDCRVPACTPVAVLAPGQKAILGVNGTCVILN